MAEENKLIIDGNLIAIIDKLEKINKKLRKKYNAQMDFSKLGNDVYEGFTKLEADVQAKLLANPVDLEYVMANVPTREVDYFDITFD